jgi:hypothetical protein
MVQDAVVLLARVVVDVVQLKVLQQALVHQQLPFSGSEYKNKDFDLWSNVDIKLKYSKYVE